MAERLGERNQFRSVRGRHSLAICLIGVITTQASQSSVQVSECGWGTRGIERE